MKREYFGMLFIFLFCGLIIGAEYIFGEKAISDYLSVYIIVWVMVGFSTGQYSMRFPKAF